MLSLPGQAGPASSTSGTQPRREAPSTLPQYPDLSQASLGVCATVISAVALPSNATPIVIEASQVSIVVGHYTVCGFTLRVSNQRETDQNDQSPCFPRALTPSYQPGRRDSCLLASRSPSQINCFALQNAWTDHVLRGF